MKQRIKHWTTAAVLSTVELPVVVLAFALVFMAIGLGTPYWFSLAFSLLVGAVGVAMGIKMGRNQVSRMLRIEQWRAQAEMIPRMLEDADEEGMPDFVREALQRQLREAKEGLAQVTR